jgi:hypothetical protein
MCNKKNYLTKNHISQNLNRNMKFWSVLFSMLVIVCSISTFAQDVQLTASVNRNPVGENDQVIYTLEVSGSTSGFPEPKLPDFADFRILGGPNVSTSVQIINGSMSSNKSYSVMLLPRKVGTFTIPAVSITHKGKTYQSNPIKITVSRQSSQPAQQSASSRKEEKITSSNDLYIKAISSRRTVYVNDQINVSFKVYFRVPIRNPDFIKLPETVGFWVEDYEIPQNIPVTQEVVNGVQYSVAEVKKMALFPTKTGQLTLTAMQLAVNVVERRRRRDPFSAFDSFFDDPFGRTVRKVIATNPLTFNVKPLPETGKPANFSGLVGNFRLQVDLDKTNVKANEALSYRVRLTGSGNLKSFNDIPVGFPASFEVYEPKIKDDINRSGSNLASTRELEYVLIPRTSGQYRIKPLEISFFNPNSRSYKTLRSQEYIINVGAGEDVNGVAGNTYLSKSEVKLLGKDIYFIKEEKLNLLPAGYKPYAATWFWASLLLPLLLLGGAYGYRNYQEKMTTNVEYARRRKAFKQAEKRLKGASHFLRQGNLAEFYGEISRGLIGFVADKTNHPAAGLLREDVDKLLKNSKVDAPLIEEYLKCLDEADFRRFAPGRITESEARAFYEQAANILAKLGKFF